MLQLAALWMALVLSVPQERTASENYDQASARGHAALKEGRIDESIEAHHKCLELRPKDGVSAYNLACGYSRKGQIDAAFDWLGKSIEWDYLRNLGDLAWLSLDTDLEPLRPEPRFQHLIEVAQLRLEAAGPPVPPATYIDWSGGHRVSAFMADFSPDGSKVLSSSGDGCVRIWDSASGELLVLLVGHRGAVVFSAWADAGRQILTGGNDSTLRLWDARTGDLLRVLSGPSIDRPCASSPDGRLILCPRKGGATLVDSRTGQRRSSGQGPDWVYAAAFNPDGKRFSTGSADGTTRLFDVSSLEFLATYDSGVPVFDVAFSPDSRWLVTAGADGLIRWLDARTLELERSFRAHPAEVNSVVFSPDGAELLTTSPDRTARVWNAADDSLRLTLSGHASEVYYATFSADGQRILTPSNDGTVRLWDARSGDLVLTLGGCGRLHRTVSFSPDATRLATFDARGAREWDLATGREIAPSGKPPSVRFKLGRQGSPCQVPYHAWTPQPPVIEIEGARVGVVAVLLAPDGRAVFSADEDERGRLWSTESGRLVAELGWLSRDSWLTYDSSRQSSAAFSPDGALLATAQHADGSARLWEMSTGTEIAVLEGGGQWATTVAFDARGEHLAVARHDLSVDVWKTFPLERVHSLRGHGEIVIQVAFRADGQVLATGCRDGTVRLWDLTSGDCLKVLRPHFPVIVCGVAFTPDGKRIAAATADHRVLLWDAESGRLLGTIVPGEEPGDWLAFAPSGHYHGTSSAIARARLVQGAISYPLSCFAAALESPEKVKASFAGLQVVMPKLPAPPSLVVAAPVERAATVHERAVRIQALATDALAGLEKIEVVQDGSSVSAELLAKALTLENNERLARLDLLLPIPSGASETKISLQAVSTRGIKSRPESFVVRYEPPKRELYLLALGVADYDENALDLQYPVRDADDLVARMRTQEGVLYHAVHVERRVDREVTAAEALRLRDEFLLRARPEDTLVVFAAGHGIRSAANEYWFLTSNATQAKPYSGINRATLESLVTWDKLHASRRVLLIDTCHAGTAFEGARGERGIAAFRQEEVDAALERSSGLYIFAATSDDAFAREQEGNGIFTRAILDGLSGAADEGSFGDKDGYVGVSELMQFARYAVLEKSAGRQVPTFPRVEGGENFPLARARVPEREDK